MSLSYFVLVRCSLHVDKITPTWPTARNEKKAVRFNNTTIIFSGPTNIDFFCTSPISSYPQVQATSQHHLPPKAVLKRTRCNERSRHKAHSPLSTLHCVAPNENPTLPPKNVCDTPPTFPFSPIISRRTPWYHATYCNNENPQPRMTLPPTSLPALHNPQKQNNRRDLHLLRGIAYTPSSTRLSA